MSILVFAETESGSFKKTAFELLAKANELSDTVHAIVLGDAPAADLGAYGASKVFHVAGDFSNYSTRAVAAGLKAGIEAAGPDAVLLSASYMSRDALPRVAAALNAGMASDVTDVRLDGGAWVARRPVYAGKAFVDVTIQRGPALIAVRPNSFPQPEAGAGSAEVVSVSADLPASSITVTERAKPETDTVDLTEADRIVSGGRSLKSEENFDAVVRPLAAALGATAGASRAAVDAGYAHHDEQVGQTGKIVNPSLYIALGISGAIQHLAGMRTSKVIVAVNKDPDAPIFEHATYGIVADLFDIAPALTAALNEQ